MRVRRSEVAQAIREKLAGDRGRAVYARRKAVVEPVFGQAKEARGFRRFSLRGLRLVGEEWQLVCLKNNILELYRSGAWPLPA